MQSEISRQKHDSDATKWRAQQIVGQLAKLALSKTTAIELLNVDMVLSELKNGLLLTQKILNRYFFLKSYE